MDPEQSKPVSLSPIQFQPLSEGLGFHPFSDGLPYAPVAPRAGAVAAGPAQFVKRLPQAQVSVPVVQPVAQAVVQPTGQPTLQAKVPSTVQAKAQAKAQAKVPQPQKDLRFEIEYYGWGYVLKRLFAYAMDVALNALLWGGVIWAIAIHQGFQVEVLFNSSVLVILAVFLAGFSWSFITFQELVFSTSFGKYLFGLKLEGGRGVLFLRALFFLLSCGFLGIGLIGCLFDRKKRCWHDRWVEVQPTEGVRI